MPAKGHAKPGALRAPKKVRFSDHESARVAAAAKARGLKEAALIRQIVLAGLADQPFRNEPDGGVVDDAALTTAAKSYYSVAQLNRIDALAKRAGLTRSEFIRTTTLAAAGLVTKPTAKRHANHDELVATLSTLAWQVRKLGTNVNQMAKQANEGLVAVNRAEVNYLLNQHQLLMSAALSAVEKVLA